MLGWMAAALALAVFWGVGAQHRLARQRAALLAARERVLASWRMALAAMTGAVPAASDTAPAPLGDAADRTRAALGRALAAQEAALRRWQAGARQADALTALDASSQRLLREWTAASVEAGDLAGPLVPDPVARAVAQALAAVETARSDFNRLALEYNGAIAQFPARLLASAVGLTPSPLLATEARTVPASAPAHTRRPSTVTESGAAPDALAVRPAGPPLWQTLSAAAGVLTAVVAGRSTATAWDAVPPGQRPAATAVAQQALRGLGRARALRDRLAPRPPPPEVDALLCIALALLTEDAPPYAAHSLVDQTVEAAKRNPRTAARAGFVNACLRRLLRDRAALCAAVADNEQARWNHPPWWIERVRADHPDQWPTVLDAIRHPPSLTLRINTRKCSLDQYRQALNAMNLEAVMVGPQGLQLRRSVPVTLLPGYAQGWFSVQDAVAQRAAPLLLDGLHRPAGRPLRVLDACAAPGGKTSHLLELSDARVLALDVDARRCLRLRENLDRLGLQAEVRVGDALQPDGWWDGEPFDAILLDAPCTASGIVRRHPDVPWLRRPGDIERLAATQQALLTALWPLLAPGGRLLYCTCSVFRDEGERRIAAFVASNTEALSLPSPGHLLPRTGAAAARVPDNEPGEHDGFYFALLERRDRR